MIEDHSTITRRFLDWAFIRLSRSTRIDGLWVGVFMEDRDKEILSRLREALFLIKTNDPYRYKRVLREIERLWAHLLPASLARWLPALKRCVVDPRFILSLPPEFIASAIVHEATHGRLMRSKIGYLEQIRYRVEKVCFRQELAFALKVPGSDALRREIERCLALEPDQWTNEALRKSYDAGEIEMARHAKIPDWLIRTLLRIREKRGRR